MTSEEIPQEDRPFNKVIRLQQLVHAAASRDLNEVAAGSQEYSEIRKWLFSRPDFSDRVPPFVRDNSNLERLSSFLFQEFKSADSRRNAVAKSLSSLVALALAHEGLEPANDLDATSIDPSDWTGVISSKAKIETVRHLLPIAQDAVAKVIGELDRRGDNGGPPLDDREEALDCLRKLHHALGAMLSAIDTETFSELGEGLPLEAVRYTTRAIKILRDDPMPYALSTLLMSVFAACGFPGAGAMVSAMALSFTKDRPS